MARVWVALLLLVLGCGKPQRPALPPAPVTGYRVKAQTIPADFEFVGVAKSSHPVEIRSRVEGYLWSVNYVEGSMVNVGDLMFQIDPRPFEANLEAAQGALARQEAILWRAQRSLERIQPLYEQNAVSLRDLDDATAQVLAAEAMVFEAKANVTNAELNLGFTRIQSPIKGLSGRAAYQEGSLITPSVNGLLTQVSVIDPIWVLFSISDNQLLLAKGEQSKDRLILPKGEKFHVTLTLSDGSLFPYEGEVNFASPTLDPKTGTLVVRATFCNPEGMVLPGQFVRATVSGAVRPNAIIVPQQSVFAGQDGKYVFLIVDGKAVAQLVEVGAWYKDYWVINQGLNASVDE
jgi:membrane fusion protein, multidrug efflux system